MFPPCPLLAIVRALLRDSRGATAIEYGLIISLIVIAMSVGLTSFADATNGMWNYVTEEVLTKT